MYPGRGGEGRGEIIIIYDKTKKFRGELIKPVSFQLYFIFWETGNIKHSYDRKYKFHCMVLSRVGF